MRVRFLGFFACAGWALSALTACSDVGLGTDVGSSGSSAGGTTPATTATSTSPAAAPVTGVSCGTDPQTGVTLCEGVTACPGVDVDPGAFPSCGFRPRGTAQLDLECLCNGESLCPIGVPTTCADATQLLEQAGSALTVCQQVDQSSCITVGGTGAGAAAASTCDRACESECQSDPGCVSLCGC